MRGNNYSRYAYIACLILVAYVSLVFYPKWKLKAEQSSLGWDAATYYWYLPATFIYHDLKHQEFGDSIIAKYDFTPEFAQSFVHENGGRVITYSSGLAFMHLPAFAFAHIIAEPLGYPADGFSLPYQVAVQFWSIICAMIGLWFFRKLLLYYYSDKTVAVTLLLLVFGSNYLNYIAIDATLTHSWLFSIYVLLMLNSRSFYLNPGIKHALKIGLLVGLAILIRPSEIIAILIPLLWGMNSIMPSAIGKQLQFFKAHFKKITLAVLCVVAVGVIQVVYWLYVAGEPLVYSYEEKGFSWLHPHFFNYTFSYRSGWLTYTPLLVFAFIGLVPFLKNGKNKLAIISFFLLNYYIVSAWDVWWYGGMGGRAMVQSYAVLFIPIASLVESSWKLRWVKWPVWAAMLIFTYVNIWFTYNAHGGQALYDPNGMTKAYYWHVIGRFNVPAHTEMYKDTDEYFEGTPRNMKLIYKNGFEEDSTATDIEVISGNRSLYMNEGRQYGLSARIPFEHGDADWLQAKVKAVAYGAEPESWKMIQFVVEFYQDDKLIKTRQIRLNRFAATSMVKTISYYTKIPDTDFNTIQVHFWNPGTSNPLLLDDVEVWAFEE